MDINSVQDWFRNARRGSTLVYYSYQRKDGRLLARACELDSEVAVAANLIRRYAADDKAVIYQRFTPETCEYIIKKI